MSSGTVAPALRGRLNECDALDRLLAQVRAGQSQVLVVQGEPGIGKSALLDYLAATASGCRIDRAAGHEYEMELAYAGLHQLCASSLHLLERLPEPQREALSAAFGLSSAPPPDRFVVGLGVLGLLSEMTEEQPVLWVIDDAQWLDKASATTLAFVAHRLLAEPVGLIFALRESTNVPELDDFPSLTISGLADADARALLDSALPGRFDDVVRDRLVAESHGNPLALLELPQELTAAELAGGFGTPSATSIKSRIERSFQRRLDSLPDDTRRLLLLAAAEPVGDVNLLWRAADGLGIDPDAVAPAQAAGLLDLDAFVRFRHPLVRSAVYQAASLTDRQEAHRALADATDPEADPDRRAWHRAHATAVPDERIAMELEQSASRAADRGGVAAAAAFLERALELTSDSAERGRRALAAAEAKIESGAPEKADALLGIADRSELDELQRAKLTRLHGEVVFTLRRGGDAPPLLLDAAKRFEPLDRGSAREAYLQALGAAVFAGRLNGSIGPREVAEAARDRPPRQEQAEANDLLLDGLVTRYTDGYVAGVAPLREALDAPEQHDFAGELEITRWFWLRWLVAGDLWDDERWHEIATRAVQFARDSGALSFLPLAVGYRAIVHLHAGEFAEAESLAAEASAISEATSTALVGYPSVLLAAWRGVPEAEGSLLWGVGNAVARGEGRGIGGGGYGKAVLYNGLGRYEEALESARTVYEYDDLGICGFALAELVEAGARSGAQDEAAGALRQLEERTAAAGTDWALGVQASSRALLSEGEPAESLYREAIERLVQTRVAVQLARAHLVYGEWLRRENRRVDAREQLRAAHDMFSEMGAQAFTERARRELQATGETARKRSTETRGLLTAQEAQIARLAQEGLSNPQIGAQLFISPRTVQYHLRKVFQKLEISSRNQLVRLPAGRLSSA
jgi:DNA-binding CsgD family transcriptional regulator